MSIIVKTLAGEQAYSRYPSLSDLMLTREKLANGQKLSDVDRENLERIGIGVRKCKRKNKSGK